MLCLLNLCRRGLVVTNAVLVISLQRSAALSVRSLFVAFFGRSSGVNCHSFTALSPLALVLSRAIPRCFLAVRL